MLMYLYCTKNTTESVFFKHGCRSILSETYALNCIHFNTLFKVNILLIKDCIYVSHNLIILFIHSLLSSICLDTTFLSLCTTALNNV